MTGQLGFLWAVAAVVWFGILAYVVALIRRQNHMQKELVYLEHSLRAVTEEEQHTQG